VRVVINDVVEREVGLDRLVGGRRAFYVVGKWHEVPTRQVRVSVVGNADAVTARADTRKGPVANLRDVLEYLPAAEEKVFTLSLELTRTEEGTASLAGLPTPAFDKYPWYGALLEGLLALHRGDPAGRDSLLAAAARWPDACRQMGEKLAEKDVTHALELLRRNGLSPEGLGAAPETV
jgi:hypothetical protein